MLILYKCHRIIFLSMEGLMNTFWTTKKKKRERETSLMIKVNLPRDESTKEKEKLYLVRFVKKETQFKYGPELDQQWDYESKLNVNV